VVTLTRLGVSNMDNAESYIGGDSLSVKERDLIQQVLRGDKAAQRRFYDDHVDRVYGLAYRMTGDVDAARDCTQQTFIRLFDKLGTFRGESALATWVHVVAVSVISRSRRNAQKRQMRESSIDCVQLTLARHEDCDSHALEAIRQAIGKLASGYRAVVILHDVEGYTHQEIAAALGIKQGTSKVRLSRARKKLRKALADYAGDLAYE